jgi:CubicO group peptidase (beta-lactamase class C family)
MNPAGGIHCSLDDDLAWARETLLGLEGKGLLLPRSAPGMAEPRRGIHCRIEDLAAWGRESLLGLKGAGRLLPQAAYARIHAIHARVRADQMYPGSSTREWVRLGYGWGLARVGRGLLSAADGSAGTFYARVAVLPAYDLVFVGLTNAADGEPALSEAYRRFTGLAW